MSKFKKVLLVMVGAVSLLLIGSAANAVLTGRGGGIADQNRFVHQTDATVHSSTVFTDVGGASITLAVPRRQTRLLDARFSAESQCAGTFGWCSVRVVVVRPNGTVLELDPKSGFDFAFDSAGPDQWESHAIERTSPRLGAGTYRVKVQTAVVAGASSLRLDDWTLAVAAVR
jgi:hypothetical protein